MAYGSLLADVVQGSTAGTPPQFNDGNGTQVGTLCRAWVNFVGSSGAKNGSFNVSSITRNSLGNYTINFTNALSASNYSICGTANNGASAASGQLGVWVYGTPTTTSVNIQSGYSGNTNDYTNYVQIFL